ncbi:MAG: tRNA lysidine(34) synthetase TilS [Chloroflexi bacterium]|nr:tRNA lysidine(34) synthetase TilS [Chloroflexota bacterium]MDA1218950.1 tRNA lysidine(34) synthetase TilS [Chloroflexota bacterium]PKB57970.1 MAG: tRNA lysidine(34) synthetase TilS [SAR202 cluster bacterium Casp-Chloro-G3]
MKNPGVVSRIDRLVADALQRAGYFGQGLTLVIAVSGGPDSSALLYSLHRHRLRGIHDLRLHVAHLNHDIRGEESDQDASFVAELAHSLDLPATIEKEDPLAYQRKHRISSFEQATREMRYSFLYRVAQEQGAPAVTVGHTADDQAETVLEHILRGSGLRGLRGMTEVSPWPWPPSAGGVVVFRPLLAAAKHETVAYCRELGREFHQDSDNNLPKFTRNRVRQELLPLLAADYNPRVTDALIRLSHTAALDLDFLERECDRLWPDIASEVTDDSASKSISFNRQALNRLHPSMLRQVLRRGYVQMSGDARRLEESHLAGISTLLEQNKTGFSVGLPRGLWLHASYDVVVLAGNARLPCPLPAIEGEHLIQLPNAMGTHIVTRVGSWQVKAELVSQYSKKNPLEPEGLIEFFNAESLENGVWVRTRQPGDRFQPLGMNVEKKLQDFFTDSKVPRVWRDRVPLLASDQGIAWVVGHRIAEWAKVDTRAASNPSTLRIEFTR